MRRAFGDEHDAPRWRVVLAFAFLTIAFALSLFAVGCGIQENRERIDEIGRVADAVCNLRGDQVRRISRAKVYLEPDAPPIPFVANDPMAQQTARGLLRQDILDRQRVVDALDPLRCPPPE